MDYLTRLAQRMNGDIPTVQPRLPFIFEPDTGIGRSPATFAEPGRAAPSEPAESLPDGIPLHRPRPAAVLPAPAANVADSAPHRIPLNDAERVRQPPPPAARESVAPASVPFVAKDTFRERQDRPPAPKLSEPRRSVPVTIRPVTGSATQPPPPTGSRRGAVTPPMNREAYAERADGPNAEHPASPTVHVRIGRVEVRAVMPPAAPSRPAARPTAPRTTLEDYLSGRKGGSQP